LDAFGGDTQALKININKTNREVIFFIFCFFEW